MHQHLLKLVKQQLTYNMNSKDFSDVAKDGRKVFFKSLQETPLRFLGEFYFLSKTE